MLREKDPIKPTSSAAKTKGVNARKTPAITAGTRNSMNPAPINTAISNTRTT
jgi:hypothetical protein